MKISTVVMYIFIVGIVVYTFASMVQEGNSNYPTAHINSSEWDSKYDYVTSLNSTITPLKDRLLTITDAEQGWFTRLAAGIAAIPYAIMLLPSVTLQILIIGGLLITNLFTALGIPVYIIIAVSLMAIVWGIFKLVEFFQRSQI
jgi:hypothetical protein